MTDSRTQSPLSRSRIRAIVWIAWLALALTPAMARPMPWPCGAMQAAAVHVQATTCAHDLPAAACSSSDHHQGCMGGACCGCAVVCTSSAALMPAAFILQVPAATAHVWARLSLFSAAAHGAPPLRPPDV